MQVVILLIGGFLGTMARMFLSLGVNKLFGRKFPYGTLTINLFGSFLAGLLYAALIRLGSPKELTLFFNVGILASLTTFSTFILEAHNQMVKDTVWHAVLNIGISILGGIFLFLLGRNIL